MSDPSQEPPLRKLPPLRIHHFLLWTIVAAVMLTAMKQFASHLSVAQIGFDGGMIPTFLCESLAITLLGLGLAWQFSGRRFFHEPGHAAIIGYSLYATYHFSWMAFYFLSSQDSTPFYLSLTWVFNYGYYGLYLILIGMCVVFAILFRRQIRWRNFFTLQATATTVTLAGSYAMNFWANELAGNDISLWELLYNAVFLAPQTLEIIFLAIVVRLDCRDQLRYHWSHWLGVAMWFVMWALVVGQTIWMLFFPEEWTTYTESTEATFFIVE